jgi:hypothetical protein
MYAPVRARRDDERLEEVCDDLDCIDLARFLRRVCGHAVMELVCRSTTERARGKLLANLRAEHVVWVNEVALEAKVPAILKVDPSGVSVIAVQCFVKTAPTAAGEISHQFDGLTTNSPPKQAICRGFFNALAG